MEYEELTAHIEQYVKAGYRQDCEKAARHAQCVTRQFVEKLHPTTAFGGRNILQDNYNGRSHNQIVKGTYKAEAGQVLTRIYANYFCRWYNTGAYGLPIRSGKYKGRKGPVYAPREKVFDNNVTSIENNFAQAAEGYLAKHIKL